MKPFMDDNFLLTNSTAEILYHKHAANMPIFDFHCHLSPQEISENKSYRNLAEIWLGGDHYKWRAMRACGVEERFITGNAPDKEKFMKWAETMPQCIGNPLYHWTHMELRRYFGINDLLSPATADSIWDRANAILQKPEGSVRGLILRSNVKVICTTDDPTDTLEYHQALARDTSFPVKVLPAFRPDKSFNIDRPGFAEWIARLEKAVGKSLHTFDELLTALDSRVEYFHANGCRVSDHGLDLVGYEEATPAELNAIFAKGLNSDALTESEIRKFKTHILVFFGRLYARKGWTMQIHIGAVRNTNARMMRLLGPDTGFDTIGDTSFAPALSRFLDALDTTNELPKTILYCMNPTDNEVLATVIGGFQGGIPGKLQFGSGWWFNDQKDGMLRQMTALANMGILSRFVGMLTDSRSFLSYTRHEYFRRILCNLIGEWVEAGEAPADMDLLGGMVRDICFDNAKNYFGIDC